MALAFDSTYVDQNSNWLNSKFVNINPLPIGYKYHSFSVIGPFQKNREKIAP